MNELIANSEAMRETISAALDVAAAPTTVLIVGESGTGKDLIAHLIHRESARCDAPMTVIRCVTFVMSEADAALNTGGTVVFDEISALTFEQQGQLLRLIEASHSSRLIATSNRNLAQLVERGTFRSDLFYRLDVFPIRVPALRERQSDLRALAHSMLQNIATQLGRPELLLSPQAIDAIEHSSFPGNVRELGNVLERAAVRSRDGLIDAEDLSLSAPRIESSSFPSHLPISLAELERVAITEALRRVNGNRTHAARLLGIGLRTLRQKLNGRVTPPIEPRPLEAS